jgi:aminodeoxyfutalosine deaminase
MRFLLAEKVFDGESFISEKSVLVVNENTLKDIVNLDEIDPLQVETLKGVITPGFVNAHCHLELSHLKGSIPEKTGLPEFGMLIIKKRNSFSKEETEEAILEADTEMWNNGIVAVGDISNSSDSFMVKNESKIQYHTFIELLGLNPNRADISIENGQLLQRACNSLGLRASLAPHAPYSTSLELISKIAEWNINRNFPSSIHNQESEDELKFFKGELSGFDKLYSFLNIDLSFFKPPRCGSLEYYRNSLQNQRTLLVHNTFSSENDVKLTNDKNIVWCFCPNANLYIENRLPDYSLFIHKDFCLGTDSLASNHQLDLISEANLVLKNSPFSVEQILRSITSIPADFLGFQNFGRIKENLPCGLNLLEIENNQMRLIEKIV